jgi:hypothetical protein
MILVNAISKYISLNAYYLQHYYQNIIDRNTFFNQCSPMVRLIEMINALANHSLVGDKQT